MSFILFYLPASGTSLVIDMNSKIAGSSQVFFGKKGLYSATNSTWYHIAPGRNKLSFPLSGLYSSLRWDPLTAGGTIEVNEIYVSILGVRLEVGNILLNPLYDIEKIKSSEGNVIVVMKNGSTDPQLDIELNFKELHRKLAFISGLLGFVIAIFMAGLLFFKEKIKRALNLVDCSLDYLFQKVRNDGFNFREIGVLVVIGSILYVYFLSTFSFSIDDEMASTRQNPSDWVSQGRWFVYLVERFIFPQPSIPFAPYIFLVFSLSVSYALLLRAHGYAPSWKTYASYPIFCAFPTWWFISEFYSNVPALGFGIFFISLSSYLAFRKADDVLSIGGSIFINAIIVFTLACAIAAYQSLLLLFMCIVFGVLLIRCLRSDDTGRELIKYIAMTLSKILLLTLLALILYFSINLVAQKIIASDSGYIDGFINFSAILKDPLGVVFLVINEMTSIYSGSSLRYGASIYISGLAILLATLKILSIDFEKTIIRLFLWSGILVAPFVFHFISGGMPLPMRTMLAVAYVSWLSSAILLSDKRTSFLLAGVIIVGLYQIQIFSVTSQYMASATITQSHDRILAADIYRRIGELSDDFDRNTFLKIDVYGKKTLNTVYANGWSSATKGSFFSWDDGNILRMVTYMKVMGYENIYIPNNDERIAMTPFFNEMPVWPAAGSVRKVGDCYLVRLSKEPDPTHANFTQ